MFETRVLSKEINIPKPRNVAVHRPQPGNKLNIGSYLLAVSCLLGISALASPARAQACPLEDPAILAAKNNYLYLYFPTAADSTFPAYDTNVSPLAPFDVSALTSGIGTTGQLIDAIKNVVSDDYCEFNVQVVTTTTNPATLASPPAQRVTVGVGDDSNDGTWGEAQEVDTGNAIAVDFARVWAGTYTTCEGGAGPPDGGACTSGALTGTNNTLEHWAQAIGGTAAHEAGHTYGLAHTDDDPPPCPATPACDDSQAGPTTTPGEDPYFQHLMPAGYNLTADQRADFRRHFSNQTYGLLKAKAILRLPDLEQSKNAVLHSLAAASSQESYGHAINEFITWYCSEPRLAFNRAVVLRFRFFLEQKNLAPSTINVRLAAVRRLA
jgi:hypothetical protein